MIHLPVDEAYAYDYLSIIYVKQEHGLVDHHYRDEVIDALIHELGPEVHVRVLNSREFWDLLVANREMWDAQDLASEGKIDLVTFDKTNQHRFDCKRRLQAKHFPSRLQVEMKQARMYENYQHPGLQPS